MGSQMQAGAPKTVEIAGQKVPVVPKKIEVEVVV